jgi:hypothetical protein
MHFRQVLVFDGDLAIASPPNGACFLEKKPVD